MIIDFKNYTLDTDDILLITPIKDNISGYAFTIRLKYADAIIDVVSNDVRSIQADRDLIKKYWKNNKHENNTN